jgi:meso-butanediol dehydrogenase / (S,S)-butanediol dehydrogenase / diacetyl reductase
MTQGTRFSGKVAIVTGGASGIGAAFARRLHSEGAEVMIADIDAAAGEALATELGAGARFHSVDVSDAVAVGDMVETCVTEYGGLDILYNNAGIGCFGLTPDLSIDEWHRVVAINLNAVFYACRAAIPHMRKRGGGAIINTASASGMAADFGFTAYNATKAAVINYTRSLAIDHAVDNIRANAVCPGPVETPILMNGVNAIPGLKAEWEAVVPAKRFARPEEIAAVAAFLVSDDASFVTGVSVPVDGGLTAHTGQPDLRARMGAAVSDA